MTPPEVRARVGRAGPVLAVLLVSTAIANVAYTILIPFVPTLRDEFGMSPMLIGLAFGGFAAAKAATQPIGGWSVDRLGPRGTVTVGLALTAAATIALGYADTGVEIVVLRLLWGVGEGIAIPALYRLTSVLGRAAGVGESRAMGWFGSASVIGMAAGPGLVALLDGYLTFQRAFLLSGALTAVAALALVAGLRRVPAAEPSRTEPARAGGARAGAEPAGRPAGLSGTGVVVVTVVGFGLLDFVNNLIYAALEPAYPLYAVDVLGGTQRSVSTVFFAGLILFAIVSAVGGALVARVGPALAGAASLLLQAVALAVAAAAAFSLFSAAFVVLMIVQPIVYVAARTGIARLPAARQGRAFGWFGLISDLGWVLGPVLITALLPVLHGGAFLALGLLACGAAVVTLAIRLRSRPFAMATAQATR